MGFGVCIDICTGLSLIAPKSFRGGPTGIVMGVSQHATKAMEDVAAAARDCLPVKGTPLPPPSPLWYQLYILKDRELTLALLRRAEQAGA